MKNVMKMWNELAGRVLSAQLTVAAALASLASSRTPGEVMARHKNLSNTVAGFAITPAFAEDALEIPSFNNR